MCLTQRQFNLLLAISRGDVPAIDEMTAADLKVLARAGLISEDGFRRYGETEVGRRFLAVENAAK